MDIQKPLFYTIASYHPKSIFTMMCLSERILKKIKDLDYLHRFFQKYFEVPNEPFGRIEDLMLRVNYPHKTEAQVMQIYIDF